MSANKECVVKNKKYILVPPDGGWGHMIWIAAAVNYSTTTMFVCSFEVIYKELYEDLDMGDTSIALLGGIHTICIALAGYFTSPLLKYIPLQRLALLAALLFNLGAFCMIFVTSMLPFFICLGLLQGTGFGILYNLSWTLINDYFLEKRLLSFCLAQAVSGGAAMIAPYIVNHCLHTYGHQGTLMVISAVSLHTFIAVALMDPVNRHLRRVEVPGAFTDEIKLLLKDKQAKETVTTPIVTMTDTEENSFNFEAEERKGGDSGVLKFSFKDVVDMTLMKKFLLSAAAFGSTFCVFSEGIFTSIIKLALYSEGWREDTVLRTVMWITICDIVTRTLFILLNKFLKKININDIYLFGLVIAFVTRLGMYTRQHVELPHRGTLSGGDKTKLEWFWGILWAENQAVSRTFLTMTGMSRCIITVLHPLILADLFPGRFSAAMGTYMLVLGILNLTVGPAIDGVFYLTESYPTVYYILSSFFASVTLLWSIELCYKRNKHKRQMQRENKRKLGNKVQRK